MKLLLVSEDNTLNQKLSESGYFQVVQRSNLHLLSQENPEVLIISDRVIDKNTLIDKTDSFIGIKYVFYMLSGVKKENETIRLVCESNGIQIIPPNKEENEILDTIISIVFPKRIQERNLFVFWGSDSKVGTTTVTQSIGQSLADHTDKNILIISLTNRPNDQFVERTDKTIDTIKNKLTARVITFDDILDASWANKNLYFLPGPRELGGIREYSLDDIKYLIDVISKKRDFIFLIDAGSDLDNPLTVSALERVTNRYLITTGQPSAYSTFRRVQEQILNERIMNFDSSDLLLIINKFDEIEDEEPSKLAADYNCTFIGTLPLTNNGYQAEKQRKTISFFNENFNEKAFSITKIIATKADTALRQEEFKRRGIFSKFISSVKGD